MALKSLFYIELSVTERYLERVTSQIKYSMKYIIILPKKVQSKKCYIVTSQIFNNFT